LVAIKMYWRALRTCGQSLAEFLRHMQISARDK